MRHAHRRLGQRRLAHELTTTVHGEEAASATPRRPHEVVFGGPVDGLDRASTRSLGQRDPPLQARSRAISTRTAIWCRSWSTQAWRPRRARPIASSGRTASRSTARRPAANRVVKRSDLLHDRYCVLRKGKKSVHLLDFGERAHPDRLVEPQKSCTNRVALHPHPTVNVVLRPTGTSASCDRCRSGTPEPASRRLTPNEISC